MLLTEGSFTYLLIPTMRLSLITDSKSVTASRSSPSFSAVGLGAVQLRARATPTSTCLAIDTVIRTVMESAKTSWGWMRTNVRNLAQFCIFVLAAGLLLLEANDAVELTWQAISLVTILTIVSALNDLEKIDFGDFGGVRFRDEIAAVERTVDRLETSRIRPNQSGTSVERAESAAGDRPTETEGRANGTERVVSREVVETLEDETERDGTAGADEAQEIVERVYDLLETEPRAALSQLRFELERAQRRAVGTAERRSTASIDDATVAAALEVRALCRTAIRDADDVDRDDAARVIDLGHSVLDRLLKAAEPDGTR